jgi:hypothetical protein
MEAIGKTCSKCGRVDPECGFFPNRRRCKDCYRESNREQMRERRKDPAYRERQREYMRHRYFLDPFKINMMAAINRQARKHRKLIAEGKIKEAPFSPDYQKFLATGEFTLTF